MRGKGDMSNAGYVSRSLDRGINSDGSHMRVNREAS